MAEYIERERVIQEIKGMDNCGCITRSVNHVCEDIRSIPTADVVERSKINRGFREIERLVEESMREAPCSEGDYRIGLRKAMVTIERYIGESEE